MNFFGVNPQFYVGDFIYKKHGTFGPRIQYNLQLLYIYEGEGDIYIDDRKFHLPARHATLLLPGHREYFVFSKKRKTRHGWCDSIQPDIDPSILASYAELPFHVPFTLKMETLAAMALPLQGSLHFSDHQLRDSLSRALFWEFLTTAGFKREGLQSLPPPLEKALRYIETEYAKACDLSHLSKVAGVCEAHLIRLFKAHTHTTPIVFLWKTRINSAARLLRETGLSISEIADRVGFQNPYHFSNLFKKFQHTTPRLYRKKSWN